VWESGWVTVQRAMGRGIIVRTGGRLQSRGEWSILE
jgi:hypothetical protein